MATFREYRYYSPSHDGEASRISMVDERNSEFYMVVPLTIIRGGKSMTGGKWYREERQRALDAICLAIDEGLEPGRVHIVGERA